MYNRIYRATLYSRFFGWVFLLLTGEYKKRVKTRNLFFSFHIRITASREKRRHCKIFNNRKEIKKRCSMYDLKHTGSYGGLFYITYYIYSLLCSFFYFLLYVLYFSPINPFPSPFFRSTFAFLYSIPYIYTILCSLLPAFYSVHPLFSMQNKQFSLTKLLIFTKTLYFLDF